MTQINNGLNPKNNFGATIPPKTENHESRSLSRILSCSREAGWTSLLVRKFEHSANLEQLDNPAYDDQKVTVSIQGECEIESFSNGFWKKSAYRPGVAGMTPPGKTDRLRFKSKTSTHLTAVEIHIPQFFFAAATEEFRRIGIRFQDEPLNELGFRDPLVYQTAISLNKAMEAGAPNLYAESAAQFLATHLLSQSKRITETVGETRNPGRISDRRLARVLDFMAINHAQDLNLVELSREAGISRFHFIYLFKKKFGITPHQHLIKLRMQTAARLLTTTDLSLKEIGARCGYQNIARLPSGFQKHFGLTPAEYRKKFV